jgi:hypothetical protein
MSMDHLVYHAFEFFCHPFEFHCVPPPPPLSVQDGGRKIRLPPIFASGGADDQQSQSIVSASAGNGNLSEKKLARFPDVGAVAGGPECALCRDQLELGAVFRLDCATGLCHRFHLSCLGQMLQRPYAHTCGLCFAPISLDDAQRIRDAFDDDKRNNRRLLHRLRDEFDDLYEVPFVSSTANTSQEDSPATPAPEPAPFTIESVADESIFTRDGIACRCGQTRQLAPTAAAQWNWCPTCQVFVGDGLVNNCKCGEAEADSDASAPLEWLLCDGCGNYSHLACWPQQVGLPDDAPFFCQQCGPAPPSPPPIRAPPPTPASQSSSSGRSSTLSIVVAAPTPIVAVNSATPASNRKRKVVSSATTFDENSATNNTSAPPKRIGRRGRALDDLTCLL